MRTRTVFRCNGCGSESPRWLGRCPGCGEWGTIEEAGADPVKDAGARSVPVPVGEVCATGSAPVATGIGELDRVLGGGLVPGSVTLLAGEPGTGKSTLGLQALGALAAAGARCLLVTAEESCAQVRTHADRVGASASGLLIAAETSLPVVVDHTERCAPGVLAVDSIQTICDPDLPGSPGSVTQVRDCAYRLVQLAKERSVAVVIVGHVTKDGSLAGPRVLEHVVDTVLSFESDHRGSLRSLRALKHRFGSTDVLGLFEMTPRGLIGMPDASAHFLFDRRPEVVGSAVAAVVEGARPLIVEVQALVARSGAKHPKRSARGLDGRRLAQVLAVLEQHARVALADAEVYAGVAGGLRVGEAGVDLAAALAVASAARVVAVDPGTVAIGEIGLGGEIRSVPHVGRRLGEAARLGFQRALVPARTARHPGVETVPVCDVHDALTKGLQED